MVLPNGQRLKAATCPAEVLAFVQLAENIHISPHQARRYIKAEFAEHVPGPIGGAVDSVLALRVRQTMILVIHRHVFGQMAVLRSRCRHLPVLPAKSDDLEHDLVCSVRSWCGEAHPIWNQWRLAPKPGLDALAQFLDALNCVLVAADTLHHATSWLQRSFDEETDAEVLERFAWNDRCLRDVEEAAIDARALWDLDGEVTPGPAMAASIRASRELVERVDVARGLLPGISHLVNDTSKPAIDSWAVETESALRKMRACPSMGQGRNAAPSCLPSTDQGIPAMIAAIKEDLVDRFERCKSLMNVMPREERIPAPEGPTSPRPSSSHVVETRFRGISVAEALATAERHVKRNGGRWPGVNALQRQVTCSKATIRKAINSSPYLSAREAEAKRQASSGSVGGATNAPMHEVVDDTQADSLADCGVASDELFDRLVQAASDPDERAKLIARTKPERTDLLRELMDDPEHRETLLGLPATGRDRSERPNPPIPSEK